MPVVGALVVVCGAIPPAQAANRPATAPFTGPSPAMLEAKRRAEAAERERRSPQALERARRSRSAHRDLTADQSWAHDYAAHGDLLSQPLGDLLRLRPNQHIVNFKGRFGAIVEQEGRREVIDSTVPMQRPDAVGRPRALDLRLRRASAGGFEVTWPEVPLRVGDRLGDLLAVGDDGLAVRPLVSAADIRTELRDGRAFWANATPDTDVVAAPTIGGVEVSYLLRSPASPEHLALSLRLPAGVTASRTFERVGGIRLMRNGRQVGSVSAPVAWDAAGRPVNVAYAIDDAGLLEMRVDHRNQTLEYPIAVDPEISINAADQIFDRGDRVDGWNPNNMSGIWTMAFGDVGAGHGINTYRHASTSPAWAIGDWYHNTPGNSYISHVATFGVQWWLAASYIVSFAQRWDGSQWREVNGTHWQDWRGSTDPNQLGTVYCNCAPFGVGPLYSTDPPYRQNYAFVLRMATDGWDWQHRGFTLGKWSGTRIVYGDNDPPVRSRASMPSEWVGANSTATMTLAADDDGVGLKTIEYVVGTSGVFTRQSGCTGAWNSYCNTTNVAGVANTKPNGTWATTEPLNALPEGDNPVRASYKDLIGNATASGASSTWPVVGRLKLDRTLPDFELGGELAYAEGRTLYDQTYALTIDATDEDPNGPRAGVSHIRVLVDGTQVQRFDQTCGARDSCPLSRQWTYDKAHFQPGKHTIRVEVYDRAGNMDDDEWLVYHPHPEDPQPPAAFTAEQRALFRVDGAAAGDEAGRSVAGIGDVNQDGIADFAVGAPKADPRGRLNAGSVYVVYGRGPAAPLDLSTFGPSDGFRIDGASDDRAGYAVAPAGDVNGDGLVDLAVGAPGAEPLVEGAGGILEPDPGMVRTRGRVYVVFGREASSGLTEVDLDALGSGGYRINGPLEPVSGTPLLSGRQPRRFGSVLDGSAGGASDDAGTTDRDSDVNGDGRDDLVIGASGYGDADDVPTNSAATPEPDRGAAFVVFGRPGTEAVDVDQLGAGGFRIEGANAGDLAGFSVATAGDVNGDELADVVVGAPGHEHDGRVDSGAGYVVFGANDTATIDLAAPGTRAYKLAGLSGDALGVSVAPAGDANLDGRHDITVAGRAAFVGFGKADAATQDATASTGNGYRVDGVGADLLAAETGDVDLDGTPDLSLSVPGADSGNGSSWIVYGRETGATIGLSQLGGHQGYRLTPTGLEALGAAADATGRSLGRNASEVAVAAPGGDRNGRAESGSVYLVPGDERELCEGADTSAMAEGTVLACTIGDPDYSVDEDRDGTFTQRSGLARVSLLRAQRDAEDPSRNRKYDKHDTRLNGLVDKDGSGWRVFRTLVVVEVDNRGHVRELQRYRHHAKFRLSGRWISHGGFIRVGYGRILYNNPTFYATCHQRVGESGNEPCDQGDLTGVEYVFKEAGEDSAGRPRLRPGQRVEIRPMEERHHERSGRYYWRYNPTVAFSYVGRDRVDFTPKSRSNTYRCKSTGGRQCVFRKPRS